MQTNEDLKAPLWNEVMQRQFHPLRTVERRHKDDQFSMLIGSIATIMAIIGSALAFIR